MPVPRDQIVAFAPGRANLIGEHTDYNDGLSLPFAVAQGVRATARPRGDHRLTVRSEDQEQEAQLDLGAPAPPKRSGDWRDFVAGAVAELGREGVELAGAEIDLQSTVPSGAGVSSSAALAIALSLSLLALAGQRDPDPVWLARLCSRIENDWVGAHTGLLDQLASLLGRAGHAVLIDFRSLQTSPVPLDLADWRLVGVDSGEAHQLSESGYGERRRECEAAREQLGLESLRDATLQGAASLPDPLDRRVRHVVEENARVRAAVTALERRDRESLAELLDASHASLRDLYDSSTEAVEQTVERLKREGAAGARMMGGGFGGTVLALFPPGTAPPAQAVPFAPCAGARLLEDDA